MRFYVLAVPKLMTGGPESLHQRCNMLNELGEDAYMVYTQWNEKEPPPLLYSDLYPCLKQVREDDIIDAPDTFIIIPETFDVVGIMKKYPKSKCIMDWLSLNYGTNYLAQYKDELQNVWHAYQSHYAYTYWKYLFPECNQICLRDYCHEKILQAGFDPKMKDNIVAINVAKDHYTPHICAQHGISFIALKGLSKDEMIRALQKCKVYVDFGTHPGRDRIPREASALGCVVITNREGSARNNVDVPIKEKMENGEVYILHMLIKDVFQNYEQYLQKQQHYCDIVMNEKEEFKSQMIAFVDRCRNHCASK